MDCIYFDRIHLYQIVKFLPYQKFIDWNFTVHCLRLQISIKYYKFYRSLVVCRNAPTFRTLRRKKNYDFVVSQFLCTHGDCRHQQEAHKNG